MINEKHTVIGGDGRRLSIIVGNDALGETTFGIHRDDDKNQCLLAFGTLPIATAEDCKIIKHFRHVVYYQEVIDKLAELSGLDLSEILGECNEN